MAKPREKAAPFVAVPPAAFLMCFHLSAKEVKQMITAVGEYAAAAANGMDDRPDPPDSLSPFAAQVYAVFVSLMDSYAEKYGKRVAANRAIAANRVTSGASNNLFNNQESTNKAIKQTAQAAYHQRSYSPGTSYSPSLMAELTELAAKEAAWKETGK